MPIDPEFVCQETGSVYKSNLVLLALLEDDLMSLLLACTTSVCGWVAGKSTFAVQYGRYREWSMGRHGFVVEETESVVMVPVTHE